MSIPTIPYHDLRLHDPDSRADVDRTVRGLDARSRLLATDAESLPVGAARPVPDRADAGLPRGEWRHAESVSRRAARGGRWNAWSPSRSRTCGAGCANASYHVRLAVAIAALAPKLRLANVLALTWKEHVDPDLRYITVHRHKTVATLRRPQVVPISDQLRLILKDARQRTDTYVVEYRGRPVKTIRGGLRSAVERAGLPFGRAVDGATFHTLRHTAASLLAELGEPEAIRKEVMGHRNIATTQRYTHLRPVHEIPAHERLADAVPIADLVTATRKRASR